MATQKNQSSAWATREFKIPVAMQSRSNSNLGLIYELDLLPLYSSLNSNVGFFLGMREEGVQLVTNGQPFTMSEVI